MEKEMEECTFRPQTKGKMGSNFATRKQSQSPARFVKGEEEFLKRKEQWIKDQNEQKDIEF
jgi:hypothetical protein